MEERDKLGRFQGGHRKLEPKNQLVRDLGFSPIRMLSKLLKDEKTPIKLKVDVLSQLIEHIHPRTKPIEYVPSKPTSGSAVDIDRYIETLLEEAEPVRPPRE